MATRVWQSTDGNWSTAGSWTGGAVPIDSDTVIFPSNNSVSVTSGLTQTGIDLAALIIHPGYIGDIGSSGTHLTISAARVVHEGSGTLYYSDEVDTDLIIINAVGNTNAAVLSGTDIAKIVVLGGKVTIDGSAPAIDDLEVSYVNAQQSDANVVIENGAGAITDLRMSGGTISSSAAITNAFVSGGILTQESTGGAITLLIIAGGIVKYNTVTTLPAAHVLAGMLDCRSLIPSTSGLTISLLSVHAGARAYLPEDLVTVTAGGSLLERVEYGDS